MNILKNNYILLLFRLVLGFIFIYAAVEKISSPADFSTSIANYRLLPAFAINFFAIILPWIELTTGILLIFGAAEKESALIINILLMLFIIVILISLLRGLNIDCGCFGTRSGSSIGLLKVVEDILLLLPGTAIMIYGGGKFRVGI